LLRALEHDNHVSTRIPNLAPTVKAAWSTSLGSVFVPYVVSVTLIITSYAFLKTKKLNEIENNKTELIISVVNSVWAILFAVVVLTFVLELLRKDDVPPLNEATRRVSNLRIYNYDMKAAAIFTRHVEGCPVTPGSNLVRNGSFESGGDLPFGWVLDRDVAGSSESAGDGSHALKFFGDGGIRHTANFR
jgi:hypothetical protein